ncbi:MAG: amino acid ABC transporter permease [Sediminispirochaetaceae bacterium]
MESITAIVDALPYILKGAAVTAGIVIGAMSLGLIAGIPMAAGQVYGNGFVRFMVGIYVWFFRGVPVLVLLFLFYFGLFNLIGLDLPAFAAGIVVLGLRSGAYQSQVFRGSIQSLGRGQMMAAQSLGMSDKKAVWYVILPQALRLSIPGWSNEYCILLKDSAITYAIGVMEIMTRGNFIATTSYRPLPIYIIAAVIFIILTYGGVALLNILEKRVRIPGYDERVEEVRF